MLTADRQRVKTLLTETITLLCKNGLHFKSEFCIEALIGITLDQNEVFLVNIKETVTSDANEHEVQTSLQTKKNNVEGICRRRMQRVLQEESCIASSSSSISSSSSSADKSNDNVVPSDRSKSVASPKTLVVKKSLESDIQSKNNTENSTTHNSCDIVESDKYSRVVHALEQSQHRETDHPTEHCRLSEVIGTVESTPCTTSVDHSAEPQPKRVRIDESYATAITDKQNESDVIVIKDERLSDEEQQSSVSNSSQQFSHPTDFVPLSFGQSSTAEMFPDAATSQNFHSSSFTTTESSQSQRRMKIDHGTSVKNNPFVCRKCHRWFSSPQGRELHEKLHDGIYRYKCSVCGKGCSGTTQLRGHMALHTSIYEFKCPYCPSEYRYKRTLSEHISRTHLTNIHLEE